MKIRKYFCNCFLLLIPLFLWNIILVGYLPKAYSPDIFWKDIPNWIGYSENILRLLVFVVPALMIFSLKTRLQKIGFGIYWVGMVIYFLSWISVILYPQSDWTTSLIGFMAPAYTTIIFFVGIGFIGNKSFLKCSNMSLIYIVLSTLFVIFHSAHAYIVFQSLNK
ncbi:hypothetical protein [Aureispira anguillae]|uniref:Uncharacterized protein n=1 Tax=Aureispira anguillae TaxID=2864201 RepID=A0A915YEA9_9BACT|nr:hypothetical protein [Aureispira anguillae]BDS11537.1 hypothetical protein AsAng_0022510 [Aureispira anguillae]